jgi:hypothetical protein
VTQTQDEDDGDGSIEQQNWSVLAAKYRARLSSVLSSVDFQQTTDVGVLSKLADAMRVALFNEVYAMTFDAQVVEQMRVGDL